MAAANVNPDIRVRDLSEAEVARLREVLERDYRVEGDLDDVQALILAAARGSIMELAWTTDAETGERVGVNPEHVVMLRAIRP